MALLLRDLDLDLDLALWKWCVRWTSSHTCGEWGIATAAPISSIRSKAPANNNNYQHSHEVMDLQLINQITVFLINHKYFVYKILTFSLRTRLLLILTRYCFSHSSSVGVWRRHGRVRGRRAIDAYASAALDRAEVWVWFSRPSPFPPLRRNLQDTWSLDGRGERTSC